MFETIETMVIGHTIHIRIDQPTNSESYQHIVDTLKSRGWEIAPSPYIPFVLALTPPYIDRWAWQKPWLIQGHIYTPKPTTPKGERPISNYADNPYN